MAERDSQNNIMQYGGVEYSYSHAGTSTGTPAKSLRGYFNISITGTWTGTVEIQVSSDNGSTWRTFASFTTNVEREAHEVAFGQKFRSKYTGTGTADVRVYQ